MLYIKYMYIYIYNMLCIGNDVTFTGHGINQFTYNKFRKNSQKNRFCAFSRRFDDRIIFAL